MKHGIEEVAAVHMATGLGQLQEAQTYIGVFVSKNSCY